MSKVRFPYMRSAVIDAVATLADPQYQQRVWIDNVSPDPAFFDDLDANIHVLYDDCRVLPNPQDMVGEVLIAGDEVTRLRALGAVLDRLIDRLGNAEDREYLADPEWPAAVQAARETLPALILGGGWMAEQDD
ncbi:hypothetical protein GFY24_16215 [Nocardia sp. SYP-A9097]|uniref:SCO4402 family protein n=1 Tax=Nocardia sp. SYP-A9097 TaxID=2663237 RepID=UPI00129BAFFD|nr:hypothetical protein [Nocardia sp. SYP-A9097]MRH88971.1 hypothetical protein [Nocardia sp. SYP-A9097]